MRAVDMGDLKRIQGVLALPGCRIDIRDSHGDTPLAHAAWMGRLDVAQVLLDAGADPNFAGEGGGTPLIMAALCGYEDVVRRLLERGAHIDFQDDGGYTALMHAARNGYADVASALLVCGADTSLKCNAGYTARDQAASLGNEEFVDLLDAWTQQRLLLDSIPASSLEMDPGMGL